MQPEPATSRTLLSTMKSWWKHAAHARVGEAPGGESLERQIVAEAKAKDDATRAEALLDVAQERRNQGDRSAASINYAEAITLLRAGNDTSLLAFALRHAADVRSQLSEYGTANAHIDEAIRLYRAADPWSPLDLANALRVAALNSEREADAAWREAEKLYAGEKVDEGVEECSAHLARLSHQVTNNDRSAVTTPL